MLKKIPYSTLKEDRRSFEIMTLRDQHGSTFADIAKDYGLSAMRIRDLYSKIKKQQIHLYIIQIAAALGHKNTALVRKEVHIAYECFQDRVYVCAYLEKTYSSILEAYRAGEAGMSKELIERLPPLRETFDEKTISRIVEMREIEKAPFIVIAQELEMTKEKAKKLYNSFYHQQVVAHINALREKTEDLDEKEAIWRRYFDTHLSPKKLYEMIRRGEEPPLPPQ